MMSWVWVALFVSVECYQKKNENEICLLFLEQDFRPREEKKRFGDHFVLSRIYWLILIVTRTLKNLKRNEKFLN